MHAYQKGPMIGEGTYGSVICATHKATGRQVAIKKVRLGSSSGKEGVNMSVLRELKALRSLAAPCVVDLLDTFSTKSSLVLVFEFMEWSLEDVIRDKNKALSEADVKSFMQMVLQALAHVHSLQAIHRYSMRAPVHLFMYPYDAQQEQLWLNTHRFNPPCTRSAVRFLSIYGF